MPTKPDQAFRVNLYVDDGTGAEAAHRVELAIRYANEMWLVATWREAPTEGWYIPQRLIALEELSPQTTVNTAAGLPVYHILGPVTKSLFDHAIPPELRALLRVVDNPQIPFYYRREPG